MSHMENSRGETEKKLHIRFCDQLKNLGCFQNLKKNFLWHCWKMYSTASPLKWLMNLKLNE